MVLCLCCGSRFCNDIVMGCLEDQPEFCISSLSGLAPLFEKQLGDFFFCELAFRSGGFGRHLRISRRVIRVLD